MCALEFTVPLVDSELGGSVIYEEWKGNLAAADAAAGAWLERARSLGPGPDLADAMLARGVVDVLTGRPRAAVEHLAEVERVVPHDPGRLVRAITYTGLARYLDVNCFPSLIGMAGAEFESRSAGFMQEIGRRWERLGALLPAATPDVGLESSLVNGLLCNLLTVRSAGADPEILSGDAMQTVLQASLSVPDQFVTPAFQAGVAPKYLAFAHLAAAGLCHRLRQVEQAGAILGQASALYAQAGDKAGVALCHMTEGDWSCAPASSPAVLNRFMKEGTQSSALSGAQEAREAATDPAALAAAASSYDQAGQAFAAARAPRGVAAVALRRGYLAMRSGDHSAAERWAAEAGSGFLAAGDALGRWVAEAHLALASVGVGRPENTDAAAAIGAWGASEGSFSWALGLGLLFARQGRGWLVSAGDVERSLACSRLAVATFRALGAEQNEAQALVDQGETYAAVGESIAAMDLYEQGVARFEQAIRRLSADPETGGAATLARTRSVMLAINVWQVHLAAMDPDPMERSAARIAGLIEGADVTAADSGPFQVVATGGRSTVAQSRVLVPLYRGVRAREDGSTDEAERQFATALELATGGVGGEPYLRAVVLAQWHRYEEAAEELRRIYAATPDPLAGGPEQFQAFMQGMPGDSALMRDELNLARRNRADEAAAFFTRTRAYADARAQFAALEQMGGSEWWATEARPWESLSDLGEVAEGLGEFPDALACYDRAIDELERRRGQLSRDELKTALSGGRGAQWLYFLAARTSAKLAQAAEAEGDTPSAATEWARAFSYAERGKARALLDLMAATGLGAATAESEPMRRWREATARLTAWRGLLAAERNPSPGAGPSDADRIATLSAQIDALAIEVSSLERELAQADPGFFEAVNPQAPVMDAGEVAAALPEGTVLVEYAFLGDDLLAWAVDREGLTGRRVAVDATALGARIRAFHQACEGLAPTEELAKELAVAFLDPVAEAVASHDRVVFVPSGPAHLLPFQALPFGDGPLVASRPVSVLPSASVLRFIPVAGWRGLGDRALAVGDPADMALTPPGGGPPWPLPALPAARLEAAFVASSFSDPPLVGEEATEESVRARIGSSPVVHLATHASLSEEAPLFSSILLAHGEALTVYELMGLRLVADLAVLSACRTAGGRATGGDDVVGLARGLLAAGARAAIVTLWPVSDASTGLLMRELYARLREGDGPAEALRAAGEWLRSLSPAKAAAERAALATGAAPGSDAARDVAAARVVGGTGGYDHPRYWAPFVVVGTAW